MDSNPVKNEALVGKLPSFDQDWAKTQFIWEVLRSQVAETELTIAGRASVLHLDYLQSRVSTMRWPNEPRLKRPNAGQISYRYISVSRQIEEFP